MDRSILAGVAAIALASSIAPSAVAQPTRFTPGSANSITLIDVVGLHDSPIGKAQNWAVKHAEDYAAGRAPFPPSAQSIMFAREVDPNGLYAVRRETAVMRTTEPIGVPRLEE